MHAWWHQSACIEDVTAKYSPRIEGKDPTHVFVIELDSKSIGWIQWYRWSNYQEHAEQLEAESTAAGIDLAIGEKELTGKGFGTASIREFIKQFVFVHPDISACVADPEELNVRSLRAFEKAGFVSKKIVQLKGDASRRWIVRFERPK
ncbi:MAG: GNAT family N-acetyltransferase [Proteobacteria bacterium]|nr:GNAT family N-acetyltransferase [Pseudomonadota bacterium]